MNNPQILKLLRAASAAAPAAAKLKKASQDIEAIFIKDLLAAMRKAAPKQSLGGSSLGADMYQDLFDQAISEAGAKNGTLGVGRTIYSQMAPLAIRTALQNAMRADSPSQTISTKQGRDGLENHGRDTHATEQP